MQALNVETGKLRGRVDRRDDSRLPTNLPATAVFGAHVVCCTVLNVSTGGAQLKPANRHPLPERFELRIPGVRVRELAHVVWREDETVGVAFLG